LIVIHSSDKHFRIYRNMKIIQGIRNIIEYINMEITRKY
jgi:hypothetical protein